MAKVLVVDDEESIIWIFRKLVEGLGHGFLSAPTAEKGIGRPGSISKIASSPSRDQIPSQRRESEKDLTRLNCSGWRAA